ncbi:MAG TPA: LamG-like jellyroll fold domain-containing protein, partial [Bacteroidales bacterium]|nr:LamG-like jellyroll fold domain-containing protein [Bacteroidales bacterium]
GTTSRIYIDGTEQNNSTVAPQTALPSEGNIGRYNNGEYFNGYIDEVRFSMSPKSADWILTEYNNQNDPSSFISLGTEVDATLLTTIGICSTTFTLDQGYPAGGTYSGTGVSGTNFNASAAGIGTHAITYTYTNASGCSASAVRNIIVTPLPAAPATANKQCCISNIVDLEATGSNLKWYSDAALTTLAGSGNPFATGQTTAGAYTYYVTQTVNGCESSATSATLTIFPGITINTQPSPVSVCEGGNATFTVSATGYNETYQWQENGVNITDGGIYSGATTSSLTLTNPGLTKNGMQYRCLITSTCGTSPVTSNSALLTVNPAPVATFSYTGTPYCPNEANPLPTFSGGGVAGVFSSTAGLVFASTSTGEVDLASSTPGLYTVTNTIAASGGCTGAIATSPLEIVSSFTWTGSAGTDWNNSANWSCGMVPNGNTSVVIPNVGNKPVISTGIAGDVNNITINAGSSLTVTGNTINIRGTITNNGTFTCADGSVVMNGTSPQVINTGCFSANTIKDLTVNNTAGVSLTGQLNVTGIVTLQNGDLSSGGNLTLISTASQTALISGSGTGNVTGSVTMQRYLPVGFGYKYFSSPFQSATVNEFSDDMSLGYFTFYKYDESRTGTGWVSYYTTTNPLVPLQGYAANFGSLSAANTVDISGTVNNGSLSITLYNHNNTYTQGFNLIGNPYPSPIDWDASAGWTKTNIDNALYYFKASTTDQYGGTYRSYINGISSDGTASNIIPSMQGFFIHVSDGSFPVTATLAMNNSVRIDNLTHPFSKSLQVNKPPVLRLTAGFSDNVLSSDPLVVYFDDMATMTFNKQLDALKLLNTDYSVANLYAINQDGIKLSVDALPSIADDSTAIPLGLKLNREGDVIFRISDIDPSLADRRVILSDLVAGKDQNLQPDGEYMVNLSAGEYNNRFVLNLTSISTGINNKTENNNMFSVYCSKGILKVTIDNIYDGEGIISLVNLTGQVIFTRKVYDKGYYELSPGVKDGIYIVTYISAPERVSKKIYIHNR